MIDLDLIKVMRTGCEASWGNVFLTNSWTLYIDWTHQQHDAAMVRLGIDPLSVLLSGSMNQHGVSFRGWDRFEITNDQAAEMIKAVKQIMYGD